jgi:hypothetical protein
VGAHWPTKLLCSFLPMIYSAKEPAMEPEAAHRNRSEGNFGRLAFDCLSHPVFAVGSVRLSLRSLTGGTFVMVSIE